MVWFKVDDGFHAHPKRYQCSLTAIGLWSVAGSWCGDQERGDGTVPGHMLPAFGGTKRLAAELVRARLWDEVDGGWRFHDWTDQNPSEQQITARREAEREKKRKWREAKAARAASTRDDTGDDTGDTYGTTLGTPEGVTRESLLTRPDPTRPVTTSVEGERPVTLRAAAETEPSPDTPTLPSEARCAAHRSVADPGPCNGCRAAREHAERRADAAAERAAREAERRALACTRCDGAHVVDEQGRPTRAKCDHQRKAVAS